jgi:hypothetical protein
MGIKKNIVFKGIQLENVYHNVSIKNISKNDNKVFEVNYIVHAYSDTKEELQRDNFVCEYNLSGDNVIAQAYNDLKTRVEYLSAIDD